MNVPFKSISCQNDSAYKPTLAQTEQEVVKMPKKALFKGVYLSIADLFALNLILLLQLQR